MYRSIDKTHKNKMRFWNWGWSSIEQQLDEPLKSQSSIDATTTRRYVRKAAKNLARIGAFEAIRDNDKAQMSGSLIAVIVVDPHRIIPGRKCRVFLFDINRSHAAKEAKAEADFLLKHKLTEDCESAIYKILDVEETPDARELWALTAALHALSNAGMHAKKLLETGKVPGVVLLRSYKDCTAIPIVLGQANAARLTAIGAMIDKPPRPDTGWSGEFGPLIRPGASTARVSIQRRARTKRKSEKMKRHTIVFNNPYSGGRYMRMKILAPTRAEAFEKVRKAALSPGVLSWREILSSQKIDDIGGEHIHWDVL